MTLRRSAVLALTLLASGCAVLTATPPDVEVQRVELRGVGLFEQSLGVTLCVTNLNDRELDFRRVTVALDVADAPLAVGASDTTLRLSPRSSMLVPFTVVITARNLGPQLLDVLRTGGVAYGLRGSVQLMGAMAITLPFNHSGRLDLLLAGGDLLADAGTPSSTRCGALSPFDQLKRL